MLFEIAQRRPEPTKNPNNLSKKFKSKQFTFEIVPIGPKIQKTKIYVKEFKNKQFTFEMGPKGS